MKKLLLTGAGGFVGSRIAARWGEQFTLCTFPRGVLAAADEAAVRRFLDREKPDLIVHTAALSNTAECAAHPDESFRANVLLPEWLAKAAAEQGAKLVAFSSDQVYAGVTMEGPLPETLALSPANVYGRHKLEMEQRVLRHCPDAVLLRAAWMYDFPDGVLPIRGNLPLNLLAAARDGTPLHFSDRDFRGVSDVREVVEHLLPALALPGGVYNFGSGNSADMMETARTFARLLGIENALCLEKGHWPRNLVMSGEKLQPYGIAFASTQEAFRRSLARRPASF